MIPRKLLYLVEKAAVELAIELAKNSGAKRAIMLPVSAPFHCELMAPAAEKMRIELEGIKIEPPIVHRIKCKRSSDFGSY